MPPHLRPVHAKVKGERMPERARWSQSARDTKGTGCTSIEKYINRLVGDRTTYACSIAPAGPVGTVCSFARGCLNVVL